MDWDDLRVFLAVARSESLSSAGKVLKLDAATVGRRISRLEEGLARKLFTRSPQGYSLTPAGQALVPHAQSAEQAARGAQDSLDDSQGELSGLIRLGAPDGCANYLLPQVITAICKMHPKLEIQLVSLPRLINLSKREVDMAISVSRPQAGRLTVQKLVDYRLVLAAQRDWLAAQVPITSVQDVKAHRVVGYIPDMIFDKELDYLSEIGAPWVGISSNSVSVQLNVLRHGAGIGIVHDFAMPAAPELQQILPEFELNRSFWLVRHADDMRVLRLQRFAQCLVEAARLEMLNLQNLP